MIYAIFWVLVVGFSATASFGATLPLRRKMKALESMCEMLVKAVKGEYDRKGE